MIDKHSVPYPDRALKHKLYQMIETENYSFNEHLSPSNIEHIGRPSSLAFQVFPAEVLWAK